MGAGALCAAGAALLERGPCHKAQCGGAGAGGQLPGHWLHVYSAALVAAAACLLHLDVPWLRWAVYQCLTCRGAGEALRKSTCTTWAWHLPAAPAAVPASMLCSSCRALTAHARVLLQVLHEMSTEALGEVRHKERRSAPTLSGSDAWQRAAGPPSYSSTFPVHIL